MDEWTSWTTFTQPTLLFANLDEITVISEVTIPIQDQLLQEVLMAASNDPENTSLKFQIQKGFPNKKS